MKVRCNNCRSLRFYYIASVDGEKPHCALGHKHPEHKDISNRTNIYKPHECTDYKRKWWKFWV